MEVVAIVNRKGGVTKTATAKTLGAGLLRKRYSVLFVDLDSQANLTYGLGAKEGGISSMDLLTREATAQEAIQNTAKGDVIAGAEALDSADMIITGKGKEYRLRDALKAVANLYDYCIIDTPTALGTLTINALAAADSLIIPVQADTDSLKGLGQLSKTLEAVKKYCNPNLYIRGILITRYDTRTIFTRDMRANFDAAADMLGTKLFSTPIRECIRMKEAQDLQTDIFSYDAKCNAAVDYGIFINEFLKTEKE